MANSDVRKYEFSDLEFERKQTSMLFIVNKYELYINMIYNIHGSAVL